jgi:hypothetical protein
MVDQYWISTDDEVEDEIAAAVAAAHEVEDETAATVAAAHEVEDETAAAVAAAFVSNLDWRIYKTFIHIDAPPIGLRRVQSAPGELSLRGTENTQLIRYDNGRGRGRGRGEGSQGKEFKLDSVRGEFNFRSRNRKRKARVVTAATAAAAAVKNWIASAITDLNVLESPPLPPPPLPPQLLHDRNRGQAVKRLLQMCFHVVPAMSIIAEQLRNAAGRNYAAAAATCGSAIYHSSVVHPQAQRWTWNRPAWRKEKNRAAVGLMNYLTLRHIYDGDDDWPDAWHDDYGDEINWHECRHCGEDVPAAWKRCNKCGTRFL